MNIIIVSSVFPPEPVVSAQMGRDLAEELVRRGANVTVLCPQPTRPATADYSRFKRGGEPLVSLENGVNVVRLPSFACPQSKLFGRLRESFSFGREACRFLNRMESKPDVIYANTWPVVSPIQLTLWAKRRQIPVFLHVQDIYPEALFSKLSKWGANVIMSPLRWMDKWVAQHAEKIIVISDGMRQVYHNSRGVSLDKIVLVPNWQDEQRFNDLPNRTLACRHYGIREDLFTFIYLGNIGPVAGVEFLIQSFHKASLSNAQLIIAGDGSAKAACVELARELAVQHVEFISDPEVAHVPLMQSLAHVCLLPVKPGAAMSSIPSKLIAYLFSAKPIIATVDITSDTAYCINEAQCGWVGNAEDADWLARKLLECSQMTSMDLDLAGKRGRQFGLVNFSRTRSVNKLCAAICSVPQTGCCA